MKGIKAAQITEVSAGELARLTYENDAWRFVFDSGLQVISYAGWNLCEHNYGAKLLVGSRDVEEAVEPIEKLKRVLDDAKCEAITFNAMSQHTHLEFLRGEDRLSLELLSNSAISANWKIINGDHEESDLE